MRRVDIAKSEESVIARIGCESVPIPRSERPATRSVDAGSPRTTHGSDGQLIEAVQLALCATGHAPLRNLKIEMCRGVVVLWGRVPTHYQKQLAQVTAQRVDGIRGISNGLEVARARR